MMQARIILVLIIALIVLGGSLAFMKKSLDTAKEERDQAIEFKLHAQDSAKIFKNLWGRETAKTSVLDLTVKNLKRLSDDKDLAWIKQFKSVNKRQNNVEQALRTTAVATETFVIPFEETTLQVDEDVVVWQSNDSVYFRIGDVITNLSKKPIDTRALCPTRTFDNHNEWFRIQGKVTADTIVVTPMVPIVLEEVLVWQRKHKFLGIRFGKKQYSSEMSTPNPYVHITENKIIRVGKKK